RLRPGRIRALQPVTKNNPVFTGSIRCGISGDERVCMNAKGWVALPGNIRPSHDQLRENNLGRCYGRALRTRLETRESAAGSDPDCAIGLLGERVQVAVVPRQTVPGIVVAPAGTIPLIHALLCSHPQPPRGIEFQEIHESVTAKSLDAFLDSDTVRLRMDKVDTAPVAITDPQGAIRPGTQRKHFLIA